MADAQSLNSLDRFRKQPGLLVLEEHGHCEVPAGCGGVVLRWRNPRAVLPLTVHLYTPVAAVCALDGAALHTGRFDLAPGRHVVSVVFEEVDLAAGLLLFAARHDPKAYQPRAPADVVERPLTVLSAADGTWKYSLKIPETEACKAPDFNDGDWPALVQHPTPNLTWNDEGYYQFRQCTDLGAAYLGLPVPAPEEERVSWWQRLLGRPIQSGPAPVLGAIAVRKVFDVPPPEARPAPE